MSTRQNRWRVGFDIGGTFTDFVLYDADRGAVTLHKRLTTAHDPSEAALLGLAEILDMAGIGHADLSEIVHGTTLVTNAIIEGRHAVTALVTTRGFRDLLEMGVEQRYDIYDLALRFPPPLVPRHLRFEMHRAARCDGRVAVPLAEDEVPDLVRRLRAEGCRVGRRLPAARLAVRRARRAAARATGRGAARHPGVAVERGGARDPRIRPAGDDLRQRRRAADDGRLSRAAGDGPCARRASRAALR
jgi:hypothetical protein